MSALAIALGVALAMLATAHVLLSVVLVRLSRDAREARQEAEMAWKSIEDWTEHARLLQNELDALGRHYVMPAYQQPWPAATGARHRSSDATVTIPTVGEAT